MSVKDLRFEQRGPSGDNTCFAIVVARKEVGRLVHLTEAFYGVRKEGHLAGWYAHWGDRFLGAYRSFFEARLAIEDHFYLRLEVGEPL